MAGREPQVFALGIKELWEVPGGRLQAGTVMHTLGYPLDQREFGGGFIYAVSETRLSVGFVVGLDYEDPAFDPHVAFQQFKLHPLVRDLLEGGQMVRYGAKALPEGGWLTRPKGIVEGALIVGDAGVLPQFSPAQRHPPRDEDGDDRRRDRLRCACRQRPASFRRRKFRRSY